jgi:hypothetical protein
MGDCTGQSAQRRDIAQNVVDDPTDLALHREPAIRIELGRHRLTPQAVQASMESGGDSADLARGGGRTSRERVANTITEPQCVDRSLLEFQRLLQGSSALVVSLPVAGKRA